ncbi:MAG TPA: ParB N-terminal domain-containing protein [Variovorax sp.]|nr:ParB N-terminal domain-containing protein [Variovorax sp.]
MTNMKQHPLSAAFPAMSDEQFQALKDSIMDIGVQEPITLFEGMVIDGWHRYTAADELGEECPTTDLGDVDPQDFVMAKNKARRHITMGQIAAAVVAVYQWKPAHRPSNSAPGAELSKSTKQLAEIAGVGTRTIEQAKAVESKATPEVKAAVRSGAMSVKKAAQTVAPPKAPQKNAPPLPDDDGGFDPLEELEAANADNTRLRTLLEADDKAAEALKWQGAYEVAQRRNDEHLTTIASRDRQIAFLARQLARCGKAVDELDQDKIAPAVEAMARAAKAAA